jgi:hypothetical protein
VKRPSSESVKAEKFGAHSRGVHGAGGSAVLQRADGSPGKRRGAQAARAKRIRGSNATSEGDRTASDEELVQMDQMVVTYRDICFRRALERALQHTDDQTAMNAVVGALGTLIKDREGAVAWEMVEAGLGAFIRRYPHDRRAARAWHAASVGCDPSQDAIGIVDLAGEVARTAFLYRAPNHAISPAGRDAVAAFRTQYLVECFGECVPSEDTLLEWFSKHSKSRSKGSLTTAGIVAQIVHTSRLFGARGNDVDKTRKRVDRALARSRKPT